MSELLDTFIGESRENLESASQELLTLQNSGYDAKAVDTIFRDIHTIKGSSDLFDIKPLTRLAHASEDLLDCMRAGEVSFTDELGDVLLEAFDQISTFFDELESGTHQLSQWEEASTGLAARLRSFMEPASGGASSDTEQGESHTVDSGASDSPATVAPLPDKAAAWLNELDEKHRISAFFSALESDEMVHVIRYTPDADCFFRGEDPFNVSLATPGLIFHNLSRKNHVEGPEDVFLCHLDITILCVASSASLAEHFAYYEGQYEHDAISAASFYSLCEPLLTGFLQSDDADGITEAAALADNEQVARICSFLCASLNPDSVQWQISAGLEKLAAGEALSRFCDIATSAGDAAPFEDQAQAESGDASGSESVTVEDNAETSSSATDVSGCGNDNGLSGRALAMLEQQQALLERLAAGEGNPASLASVNLVVSRVLGVDVIERSVEDLLALIASGQVEVPQADTGEEEADAAVPETTAAQETEQNVSVAPEPAAEEAAQSTAPAKAAERQVPRTLKVNQEKIDYLMDLVGELTVAKNSLPYLARQAEEEGGSRKLSKQIKSHFTIVNRLTEELQSAVLQIRMVPVSHVFQRYPRLVRDLARKLDKKIELEMQGEDTEFDKNLIESLSEPLIHLLRNSIDHGIESPADRLSAGKNESGKIELIATPQDDNVVIEIRDDGKGIDPAKIKMLAYQKGVITEAQLESINDDEALQLIFAPGFSTSEQVSDLSGRGVGMDAVKTMVTQAGGHIEMQSEVGSGTRFRLVLPQTMSVNRVMMFEVSDQMFGVSMDSVVETVKVRPEEIQQIKNHQVLVIRDKLVPLHCLRDYLGFAPETQNTEEQSILVVNTGNGDIGLVIDKFHEGIDVIQKPLEGVMAGYAHFSGTALLGDGRVLLIINIPELLSCR